MRRCGAVSIAIGFYAGNLAGRMSMGLNSIKFFKSATSMHSIGVVDLIVIPLPIHYHVNRFPLFAFGMQQVKMPHLNKKTPHRIVRRGVFFIKAFAYSSCSSIKALASAIISSAILPEIGS